MLHPIGGNVLFARRFLEGMPKQQPLLCLQARGLDGRKAPFFSVRGAAHFYLDIVRRRQPSGPYYLGGPSFGGTVAYEMACMLAERGERVGLLAMFDAIGPDYPRLDPLPKRALRRLWRMGTGVYRVLLARRQSADALFAKARIPEGQGERLDVLRRVSLAHEHAVKTYRPRRYHGPVLLFRATAVPVQPGLSFDDPTNGWGHVASDVRTIPLSSTHQELLDPPWVEELVEQFSRELANALRQNGEHAPPPTLAPES
jgi:thioesterase domain-containing protein